MIFLLALLPATGLTIAGYVVLYLSSRSEGSLRTFGRYLGFWAFTLAALVILGAIIAAAHGGHRGMHCPWGGGHYGPPMDERGAPPPPGEPPREPASAPAGTPPPDTH